MHIYEERERERERKAHSKLNENAECTDQQNS